MKFEVNVELLRLLCDQGKIAEAEALVDRYVARLEWELDKCNFLRYLVTTPTEGNVMTTDRYPDAQIENHGSLYLVRPLTDTAARWIGENVDEATFFGQALVVEHRYIEELVEGMRADGMRVI